MSTPGTEAERLTLLRTKLHKPQVRTDWVRRPRLLKRLNQGPGRKLTLVSAPAGFGKSSLVTGWLSEAGQPAAWLSLDDGDNDPVYIRRWLDVGRSIGPLLRDLRAKGNTPQVLHPYLDALLEACRKAFGGTALQPVGEMLDPLTPRELDVIRLICAGYSNPELASELVVAVNGVSLTSGSACQRRSNRGSQG